MKGSLFRDDNGVSVVIGHILNLMVLIIITGTITGAFFLFTDSSAKQSIRAGYTDMGSEIARDITNIHISNLNFEKNTTLVMERTIPLTIGGRGYSIELRNAAYNPDGLASIVIKEPGFSGYEVSTKLNLIDTHFTASGVVFSGSGILKLFVIKNQSGEWIEIK